MQAALLFHISLYDLSSHAGGKIAMLALLDKHGDHDLRIAPGGYAGKPAIVLKFLAAAPLALAQIVADDLGAARLAGKINALQMGAGGCASGIDHAGHGVGNGDPVLRIERYVGGRIVCAQRLFELLGELVRGYNVGPVKRSPHRYTTDRVR